jgi:hypothetical protein
MFASLRAKRSNPEAAKRERDCFVARAPRNDGVATHITVIPRSGHGSLIRPGNGLRSSTLNFSIPYPRRQNLAYPDRVLSNDRRFLEAPVIGRSESWPDRGAPGRPTRLVAKVERREALRPTSLGAHGWRYQPRGAKRLLRLRGARSGTLAPPAAPPPRAIREGPANLGRTAPRERGTTPVIPGGCLNLDRNFAINGFRTPRKCPCRCSRSSARLRPK